MVVKPKTIIGAEPPKVVVETKPSKPVEVAEAPKAPKPQEAEVPKIEASKAPEPKPAAKPVAVKPAAAQKSEAVAEAEDEGKSDSCMQGATLGDWNADLPCSADGTSSNLRIEFKD
jgi:outer membrane biosynthesis protein TonB